MRNMFKQLFGDGSSTDKDKKKSKKKDGYTKAREPEKPMPTSKEMQAKRTNVNIPTTAAPGVRKAQQAKAKALTTPTPAPTSINPEGMTGTAKPPAVDMMRQEAATAPGMVAEGMAKSVGEAKTRGANKFIGKDGRQKAAVTKEELEASGLSLRDYLNQQQGKTRRPEMKSGGKVKNMKSGGKVRGAGIARKGTRACKIR
jgi:hypothetical protein